MNSLNTLIKRLEAATSRLEDIASSNVTLDDDGNPIAPDETPDKGVIIGSSSQSAANLPRPVADLDILSTEHVTIFLELASALDPIVAQQAQLFSAAFATQRHFVLLSCKAKKPDPQSQPFQDLAQKLGSDMVAIDAYKENNMGPAYKDHLNMLSASCEVFHWLLIDDDPADHINAYIDAAQFYGNRIMKEHREKDPSQVTFVKSYFALLNALERYVKLHFPKGIQWTASGVDLSEAMDQIEAGDSSEELSQNGAPPPPPPPPPGAAVMSKPSGGDMGAVFAQLNKGGSVTSGLRKVDKSEMTHKNSTLRGAGIVPDAKTSSPAAVSPAATVTVGEPKKLLDGNKWIIENHHDLKTPIEIDVTLSQSILISQCRNTTVQLHGKANAVSVSNCHRLNIIIDRLVSSVDVVKSPDFALQVLESLPTVMLDQVDGASIYLSKNSLDTEVYTSKCSGVNINLPPAEPDQDYRELPVPEQIRTVCKGGVLVSETVEHAG